METPSGFNLIRLGDVAEVFDGPHATPRKVDSGPWYLNIASLTNGRVDLRQSTHIHHDDVAKWTRRVQPQQGDTLFSYETRLGEAGYWDSAAPAVLGRRMGLLRPKPGRVIARYLTYAYLGEQFQEVLRKGTLYGVTVNRIPVGALPNWPILLPSIEEQQRIAGVLGAFDDLIETNHNLARDCEEMLFASVRALADGAPSVAFGSIAKRVNERVLPSNIAEDDTYLGLEHFGTEGVGLNGRGTTSGVTSQSQLFDRGDVLYGKLRPYFRKVARPGFSGVCSGEIWVLRTVDDYPQAALHAVVHSKPFSQAATAGSGGTKMPRADWKHMAAFPVPDVRSALTRDMSEALESLWGTASELRDEADDLTRQRDELLPLLMSGKVRVSEVEGSVP